MPKPKILLLDIETAPGLGYFWKLFDENIGIDQIIRPSRVICWGAKWIGASPMLYADERGGVKKMFAGIHVLLSEADAVVTYNGDRFDLQKLNGGFVEYRFPPVPPVTSIDLYKAVKKLGFQSNKLAFVAPFLKIGEKVKTEGFPLWSACTEGDAAAWKRMRRYNEGDVRLLQGLYRVMRPHIKNHPYMGLPERRGIAECPMCQSNRSQSRGFRRTKAFLVQRLHCLDCGGWYEGVRRKA